MRYSDLERDPDRLIAVNVGGEGSTLLDTLARRGPLRACLGLFPDVVGRLAIDFNRTSVAWGYVGRSDYHSTRHSDTR